MHVQSRAALIADQLDQFIVAWQDANTVAADLASAYNDLAFYLGNVGVVYQDQTGSKQNNPGVHGLHIGELLDMLHTLYVFSQAPANFLPAKFWNKLVRMRDVMREYDLDDSSGEEHD